MADNKIRLPSSGGGLVNYYDDAKSKIEFKPHYIVAFVIGIIILEILLHKVL